jgi:hypothetical protein
MLDPRPNGLFGTGILVSVKRAAQLSREALICAESEGARYLLLTSATPVGCEARLFVGIP